MIKKYLAIASLVLLSACGTNQFPEGATAIGGLLGGVAGAALGPQICGTATPTCAIAGGHVGTALGQTAGAWEMNRRRQPGFVGQGATWGNSGQYTNGYYNGPSGQN